MGQFADSLPDAERRRARLYAYSSTLSGCISEVMLDSSAIIILLLSLLKASPTEMMLSSSFGGILGLLLQIPCAAVNDRIGLKRSVRIACWTGFVGFLLIAASPWLPARFAVAASLLGIFIYTAQRSLYGAAWYPLLDNFLRTDERGKFFSVMRTAYMVFTGVLFFVIGIALGKNPPFWILQAVIAVAGVALLVRLWCIDRFPMPDEEPLRARYDFKKALKTSVSNAPLTGFSLYLFLIGIAYTSLLPLALVYLRESVRLDPGTVQILSSVGIGGCIAGYFSYGRLTAKIPLKYFELCVHLVFIAAALAFFLLRPEMPGFTVWIGVVLFVLQWNTSWVLCNNSMEYMALARPGNKTMAIAFCQTYLNAGTMLGRGGSSLLLSVGLLAPAWSIGGYSFTIYHSLFLTAAIILTAALAALPILPSFVPEHDDYYQSDNKKN